MQVNPVLQIGTQEWFEDRARSSLKLIAVGQWDLSDSALLYTPEGMKAYEAIQKNETQYKSQVTDRETALIAAIAPKIANTLPSRFNYFDLGPGTEHKEQYFFDAIKKQGKDFVYCPVDVNGQALEGARRYAEDQGVPVRAYQVTFEELPNLTERDSYNFISLGLTVINYETSEILNLLKRIIAGNGSAFITLHLRNRIDMDATREAYASPKALLVWGTKLALVGIDLADVSVEVSDEILIRAKLRKVGEKSAALGLRPGDTILLQRTYRYDLEDFKEKAKKHFDLSVYDEGLEFVGITLLPK